MKFLCDVHIPIKLANFLSSQGFETLHVNNILDKWHTTDKAISKFVDERDLILITKDSDFKNSYLLKKTPKKLIKINLGNISIDELILLFQNNISHISKLEVEKYFMIELEKNHIVIYQSEDTFRK
jgi:predicted nuclease of predicted toxin-antitoxin system